MKRFVVLLLTIILCTSTFAETMYVGSKYGLNLRENKSTESDILEVIPYTDEVEIIIKGKKWYRVEHNDIKGYVQKKYLVKDNPLDDYRYLGSWHITAYTHTGNVCANGNYPTAGYTVASNSLDFGTQVYIKGIGFRTVEDRGPESLGSEWIDLFCDGYSECVSFGSQYLDVWLVNE